MAVIRDGGKVLQVSQVHDGHIRSAATIVKRGTIDWNDRLDWATSRLQGSPGTATMEAFMTARLTTSAGSPIADYPKSAAAGPRGPALMRDWRLVIAPTIKPDRLPRNS
jgi:hypothetical protein